MTIRGDVLTSDERDTTLLRTQFVEGASLEQVGYYHHLSAEVVLAVLRGKHTIQGQPIRFDDELQGRIDRRLAE